MVTDSVGNLPVDYLDKSYGGKVFDLFFKKVVGKYGFPISQNTFCKGIGIYNNLLLFYFLLSLTHYKLFIYYNSFIT